MRVDVRMAEGGRVVIPAALRKALELREGDLLTFELEEDGRLSITTPREALRRLRTYLQSLPSYDASISMADELIAERRAEAQREDM